MSELMRILSIFFGLAALTSLAVTVQLPSTPKRPVTDT